MINSDYDNKNLVDILKFMSDIIVTLTEKINYLEENFLILEKKINSNDYNMNDENTFDCNDINDYLIKDNQKIEKREKNEKKSEENNIEIEKKIKEETKNKLVLETLINRRKELDKKLLELSNYQDNLKKLNKEPEKIESINNNKIDIINDISYTTKETLINRRKCNFGRRI